MAQATVASLGVAELDIALEDLCKNSQSVWGSDIKQWPSAGFMPVLL